MDRPRPGANARRQPHAPGRRLDGAPGSSNRRGGAGNLLYHHALRPAGFVRIPGRHPRADANGARGRPLPLHLAVRRHPALLVSDTPVQHLGSGAAAGHCGVARRPLHPVDGVARRRGGAGRLAAAGVGRPRIRLSGTIRSQVPALPVPPAALLHSDGGANADGGSSIRTNPPDGSSGSAGKAQAAGRPGRRRAYAYGYGCRRGNGRQGYGCRRAGRFRAGGCALFGGMARHAAHGGRRCNLR